MNKPGYLPIREGLALNPMKKDIHPTYHAKVKVTCACGNEFETGSTVESIQTELCSMCHPFFTGTQKIIDSARRVEKFQARASKKATAVRSKKAKQATRRAKRAEKQEEETRKQIGS